MGKKIIHIDKGRKNMKINMVNGEIQISKKDLEKIDFPSYIITRAEKERYIYYMACIEYLNSFSLSRPEKSTSHEYRIIKQAVKNLSPLTKPKKLADFLNIDIELVYFGMEKGYIEYIKLNERCSVKTACIILFLKKFSVLLKYFDN